MIPEILATFACGLFTGAAIYVNLVEHPARLSCRTEWALAEWKPSYRRGAVLQASLALIGTLFAVLSSWLEKDLLWLAGGIIFFAVIPFTLIVILPTNKRLESPELDATSAQTSQLLRHWGDLHAVRSVLSLLAFLIFLVALGHHT